MNTFCVCIYFTSIYAIFLAALKYFVAMATKFRFFTREREKGRETEKEKDSGQRNKNNLKMDCNDCMCCAAIIKIIMDMDKEIKLNI